MVEISTFGILLMSSVPGKIKIVLAELSFGSELIAAWTVENWPDPAGFFTCTAPAGGVVREARFSTGEAFVVNKAARTPRSKKTGANMATGELSGRQNARAS